MEYEDYRDYDKLPYRIAPRYDTKCGIDPVLGNLSYNMFPEKFADSRVRMHPDSVNSHMRSVLTDYSVSDTNPFEYERPRRNNHSESIINIHQGGRRVLTEPDMNPDFNLSFMDRDPRGSTENIPYYKMREIAANKIQYFDFLNDGATSEASNILNPGLLNQRLRSAQNFLKDRLKIFATSFDNRPTASTPTPHLADLYKSDTENPYDMVTNVTYESPINQVRATTRLSNMLHAGSKNLRSLSTTDHRVSVAGYGQLFRQFVPDLPVSAVSKTSGEEYYTKEQTAKNIHNLMASRFGDGNNISMNMELDTEYNDPHEDPIRRQLLVADIMAILGFTENDIKYLDEYAEKNNRQAKMALSSLHEMIELTHKQPTLVLKELKNSLLMHPTDTTVIRHKTVINPKVVEFMEMRMKHAKHPEQFDLLNNVRADFTTDGMAMFVDRHVIPSTKSIRDYSVDIYSRELGAVNYRQFFDADMIKNRNSSTVDQILGLAESAKTNKAYVGNYDNRKLMEISANKPIMRDSKQVHTTPKRFGSGKGMWMSDKELESVDYAQEISYLSYK